MATEQVQAYILHKQYSGESSLRLWLLTRAFGIITALYKGGRTPKKQALIQPFTPIWLTLDIRREWYYVRNIECDANQYTLAQDALFSGMYLNELIFHLLKPQDPYPDLYDTYEKTLQMLSTVVARIQIEPILRRFEITLLANLGYALVLTSDAHTGAVIEPSMDYHFIPGTGFVVAQKGISGAHIIAFAKNQLDSQEILYAAKKITRKAVDYLLEGKVLNSRKLFL